MIYEQETTTGKRWFVPSKGYHGYYAMVEFKLGQALTCSGEHCRNRRWPENICTHMVQVMELEVVLRPLAEEVSEW